MKSAITPLLLLIMCIHPLFYICPSFRFLPIKLHISLVQKASQNGIARPTRMFTSTGKPRTLAYRPRASQRYPQPSSRVK